MPLAAVIHGYQHLIITKAVCQLKQQRLTRAFLLYLTARDMSKLSREDILRLAELSRLRLADEEINRFESELPAILDYVEMLNQAHSDEGLEPTYQVSGLKNSTRPDEVQTYQATPADLLKNAPATKNGQFKVKKVL